MQPIAPQPEAEKLPAALASDTVSRRRKVRFEYGNGDSPLPGYVIKRGLGAGGFGEVYQAQSESGKYVALKRILRDVDVETRGVRQCLNLRHPNLIALYDLRQDADDQSWVIMELVEGESLRAKLDRSPSGIPRQEADELFAQLVAGVTYLHDQGLVHRDLKPANIFIENGLVKIGDYGLSKFISTSQRGGQTESVGTFHYMAPEIGRGEYGKEIDIYALGIIYYEMLTGDVPFDGESVQEIIIKHLSAAPDLTVLPQDVRSVIGQAIAKDSNVRFRGGREFLTQIGWRINSTGLAVYGGTTPPKLESKGTLPVARRLNDTHTNHPFPFNASLPTAAPATPPPNNRPAVANQMGSQSDRWVASNSLPLRSDSTRVNSLYREPIAKFIHFSSQQFMASVNELPGIKKNIAIAILVFSLAIFAIHGGLIPVCAGLVMYAIYYPFYYFVSRTKDLVTSTLTRIQRIITTKEHVSSNHVEIPEPLSVRIGSRLSGIAYSGFVWSGIGLCYAFLGQRANGFWNSQDIAWFLWFSTMALIATWTILLTSSHSFGTRSRFRYRMRQALCGVLLGAISAVLAQFVEAPNDVQSFADLQTLATQAYADKSSWLSHVGFFTAWMFLNRWWTITNRHRAKSMAIGAILWSSLIGATVAVLVNFDFISALILPAIVSLIVQTGALRAVQIENASEILESKHAA